MRRLAEQTGKAGASSAVYSVAIRMHLQVQLWLAHLRKRRPPEARVEGWDAALRLHWTRGRRRAARTADRREFYDE